MRGLIHAAIDVQHWCAVRGALVFDRIEVAPGATPSSNSPSIAPPQTDPHGFFWGFACLCGVCGLATAYWALRSAAVGALRQRDGGDAALPAPTGRGALVPTRGPQHSTFADQAVTSLKAAVVRWRDFEGRSSRQEYWVFVAISALITLSLAGFGTIFGLRVDRPWFYLATVPMRAVYSGLVIRRRHDLGLQGAPYLAADWALWLFALFCAEVSDGEETYSPLLSSLKACMSLALAAWAVCWVFRRGDGHANDFGLAVIGPGSGASAAD